MTDREDPPEGFLERWSRKKAEAERETPVAPAAKGAPNDADAQAEPVRKNLAASPEPVAFDLASLPSLESITSVTDLRGFLAPGVPGELTRAALRRAWAADPAIRDFVGLAENAWDFTDPTAMPGFGDLPAGYDVKKLVAQIFGERDAEPESSRRAEATPAAEAPQAVEQAREPAPPPEVLATGEADDPERAGPSPTGVSQIAEAKIVQCDNIIASHKSISEGEPEELKSRRQHGSALPQ